MPEPRVTRETLEKAAALADLRAKKSKEELETRTPDQMTEEETRDHIQRTNQFMFNGVGGADYHAIKDLAEESAKSAVEERQEEWSQVVEAWARASNEENPELAGAAAGVAISDMINLVREQLVVEFFAGAVIGIHIAEIIYEEDKENA